MNNVWTMAKAMALMIQYKKANYLLHLCIQKQRHVSRQNGSASVPLL